MKIVLKPLAKRFLLPLGLTAAALATDAAIQQKILNQKLHTDKSTRHDGR